MSGREIWKQYYPPEWHDDQTMDVLFSPFRQNREINPHSWDKKLQFWTEMLRNELFDSKKAVFDASQVSNNFVRKGSEPKCFPVVLQEMHRSGHLLSRSQFESNVNQGWMSWGFDVLVKRPAVWSWGKVFGANVNPVGDFVMLDVVKAMADQIALRFREQEGPAGNLIEMNELLQKCTDICADMDTLNLVVLQLIKDKKAVVAQTEKNQKVVSFITAHSTNPGPVSEVELKTLQLRKTEAYLYKQIMELSDDMERCKNDARFYLKKGLKTSAKNALRRKQTLGRMLAKREVALETVHGMLQQIYEAESHKKILDAYKAGASAFKDVAARHNLTTDNIEEVMSDVQEAFDMQAEINESMSVNPADATLDITTAELEEELNELLAADSRQPDASPGAYGIQSPGSRISSPSSIASPQGDASHMPHRHAAGYPTHGQLSPHVQPFTSPARGDFGHVSPRGLPPRGLPPQRYGAEDSNNPSRNSGANSNSFSFGSNSSESDILDQLEALKVIEEMNLPEVPTFDPATPPRQSSGRTPTSNSPQGSRIDKSRMRPLTS